MKEHRIHSLPVIDGEQTVRGVVDAVDIATAYAEELERVVFPTAWTDTVAEQLSASILVRLGEPTVLLGCPTGAHEISFSGSVRLPGGNHHCVGWPTVG